MKRKQLSNGIRSTTGCLCVATLLAIAGIGYGADEAPLWEISDKTLRSNNREIEVILQPVPMPDSGPFGKPLRSMRLLVSLDGPFITYKPVNSIAPFQTFKFDSSNEEDMAAIKKLLEDFDQVNRWFKPEHKKGRDVTYRDIEERSKIKRISMSTGDYKVHESCYNIDYINFGNCPFGGNIPLMPVDKSKRDEFLTIEEPTGLLFAINTLKEIRQSQIKAIATKEKQAAAKEMSDKIAVDQKLASARAEQEERIQQFEAAERARVERLGLEKELAALAQKEEERKSVIRKEFANLEARKVADFFASKDGKDLVQRVKEAAALVAAKEEKEHADIYKKRAFVQALMQSMTDPKLSPAARHLAQQQFNPAFLKLQDAEANKRDSSELSTLKFKLDSALEQCKAKLGIPFDEALKIHKTNLNDL